MACSRSKILEEIGPRRPDLTSQVGQLPICLPPPELSHSASLPLLFPISRDVSHNLFDVMTMNISLGWKVLDVISREYLDIESMARLRDEVKPRMRLLAIPVRCRSLAGVCHRQAQGPSSGVVWLAGRSVLNRVVACSVLVLVGDKVSSVGVQRILNNHSLGFTKAWHTKQDSPLKLRPQLVGRHRVRRLEISIAHGLPRSLLVIFSSPSVLPLAAFFRVVGYYNMTRMVKVVGEQAIMVIIISHNLSSHYSHTSNQCQREPLTPQL